MPSSRQSVMASLLGRRRSHAAQTRAPQREARHISSATSCSLPASKKGRENLARIRNGLFPGRQGPSEATVARGDRLIRRKADLEGRPPGALESRALSTQSAWLAGASRNILFPIPPPLLLLLQWGLPRAIFTR